MKTIKILDITENPCLLAPEKAVKVAEKIKKYLQNGETVQVDFSGYEFLSSSFLNRAIGQIIIDMDLDKKNFKYSVKIAGLQDDDVDDIYLAIDNADLRRKLLKKGVSPEEYYTSHIPA